MPEIVQTALYKDHLLEPSQQRSEVKVTTIPIFQMGMLSLGEGRKIVRSHTATKLEGLELLTIK